MTHPFLQYSLKKNRVLLGFIGEQSEQQIISELDSALNQWVDSVPDHRKFNVLLFLINSIFFPLVLWDPHREHPQFFEQSALIYANYYHVQILIHRPFIPTPDKPSSTSFPSLAICTNAARSCSHILDAQLKKGLGHLPYLQVRRNLSPSTFVLTRSQVPAFTAAIVLLLNIWGGIRSGAAIDPEKGMVDVGRCMNALKACEDR